jgi:hypothetical protein
VERDDELHRTEGGTEVAPHPPADGDDLLAELGAQLGKLLLRQGAHVLRRQDVPEEGHVLRSTL